MQQILLGLLLGIMVSLGAWRARALSTSGAWAAALSGGLIFALGGFPWAILLLVFFISSSALSRIFTKRKSGLDEKFQKGSRRDWGQVLANGGLGASLAVVSWLYPENAWPWIAFAGSMAAVNADTWATELGVLNPRPPRLITTWKVVPSGSSGGVSPLGSLASLAAAAFIALLSTILSSFISASFGSAFAIFIAVTLGGLSGSFFDSLLGATVQTIYTCPACSKETERHPLHLCGAQTTHLRGWRWLNNDMVNFAASLVGALIAVGLWAALV